jgi:hypothetical protein
MVKIFLIQGIKKIDMKKLLLILLFQFFSTQILAVEDSVFYCVETQNQLMFSDSNNSKVNLEGFVLKKDGEFIELKGSIFGNKDSLNPFTKLDVVTDYQGELFARSWERSMLLNTNSGLFLYSHLDRTSIKTVIANCEVF